jgi:site-specific recombinase XerD
MQIKPSDFAIHVTGFLSEYLPKQKNASKNTVSSYRDTFKLLIRYCQEHGNIPVERLQLNMLSHELIKAFLEWLETEKKCSISTRNQRLAAIHSFFRYAQYEEPEGLLHFQKVISLPVKKAPKPSVPYLTTDAIQLLLSQPDKTTAKGRRDLTLLSIKQHNKLTKEGVAYIISQYVHSARAISTIVPEKVTPHMFRHSKAMHLLQANVNLIYIRDFLGHEDIKTTEIYAK